MIFKQLQNIDTSYRFMRLLAIFSIAASVVVSLGSLAYAYWSMEKSRERVYVLDKGKSLMLALSQDIAINRPVEARSHVRLFHELFFTISPDNAAIKMNLERAFYLADNSVYKYYTDLREASFYRRVIANNITQRIVIDSISVDMAGYPYRAQTFAHLFITRKSNVTTRSLVSECSLTNESRSDNNPHGFLIRDFVIKFNEDIDKQVRH